MIHVRKNVTDLAGAYLQICEFNQTLEKSWIPGFFRSYERRQSSYLEAVHRYEERSMFTKLLFKKPKPPGKPPPGLQDEVAGRLWNDWIVSISDPASSTNFVEEIRESIKRANNDRLRNGLEGGMYDRIFIITELQSKRNTDLVTAVIGPDGGWIVSKNQDEVLRLDIEPFPDREIGNPQNFQSLAKAESENNTLDQLAVFKIIDGLLSIHQNTLKVNTISAQQKAEYLMGREKDSLLKLAATL